MPRQRSGAIPTDYQETPTSLTDNLPDALKTVRTRPLFVMRLDVRKLQIVGAAPGGVFEGERLSGEVLEGGDVRLVLKTKDDALIGMTYRGPRHGPAGVIEELERGEVVDPASYYFRINPLFETAAPQYDWLNRVIAAGVAHRLAEDPDYSVFEVL
jgi:hypothetical protein